MNEVRELTEQGIKSVTPENWQKYIKKAIRDEDKLADHDGLDVISKVNVNPVIIDNIDYSSESDWVTDNDDNTTDPPFSSSSSSSTTNPPKINESKTEFTIESETSTPEIFEVPVEFPSNASCSSFTNLNPCPSTSTIQNQTETETETVCHNCCKDLKSLLNFHRHSLTYEKCNRCQRVFCGQRTKFRLKSHQKSCQGVKLGYVCYVCNKQFKFQSKYNVYVANCNRKVSCETCNSKFKCEKGLRRHRCSNKPPA